MDKSVIIILIILVCICLSMNSNNDTVSENFTVPVGSQWQQISQNQCDYLKERIVDPQRLMDENCDIPDTIKERDAINHGVTCLNNVNRKIFNDREQKSWCAAANGEMSDDIGFYSAQSNHVVNNETPMVPDNSGSSEVDIEQIKNAPTKTCRPLNSTIDYDLVGSSGFMPNNTDKLYSVPHN